MPTAVIGEAGEEGPVIAILGEFDALPGLSQEPGVADHSPIIEGGNGNGCGHNLLGSAALLAATAVKDWLAETGIKARVRSDIMAVRQKKVEPQKHTWPVTVCLMMLVLLYLGIRLPLMRFSMVIHLRIVELISLLEAKRPMLPLLRI